MDLAARREAVQIARTYLQNNPLVLDTETTGTGPKAEVIEIAVVDAQGGVLFESFVKPRGKIEADATRIHGITEKMVEAAPEWQEVWPQVEKLLLAQPVGAYNSDFDLRLLKQTHQRYWMSWIVPDNQFFCIMKLYARFAGEWDRVRRSYRWQSLEHAGRQCDIRLSNTHHAADDALLALAVLKYMANWTEK
jgi:DNA polymerase III subunit epsilon